MSWRGSSRIGTGHFLSESSVYRILRPHDLIHEPGLRRDQSGRSLRASDPTRTNELWQTDFTYLRVVGLGLGYYLSTVLAFR